MKKKILSLFIISLFLVPFLGLSSVGATNNDDLSETFGLGYVDGTQGGGEGIVLGDRDPRTMVAQLINVVLTLLGIVAVVIVLLGGFKWMTAAGNEDKVSEAKKLLGAGVIGLVIILAAWGISRFILEQLMSATQ
ncbi:MAG TPA: pilin [bacterium]|nr:pilin [bacterium]